MFFINADVHLVLMLSLIVIAWRQVDGRLLFSYPDSDFFQPPQITLSTCLLLSSAS